MSELTKEYFEQVLDKKLDEKLDKKFAENNKNLVTKEYFDEKLEEKTKNFVTKEYFDEKVGELVTFKQLGAQIAILSNNFDKKMSGLAEELKAHAEGLQEELAQMVGDGFVDIVSRLDVRKRVDKLEEKMAWEENKVQI